MPSTKKKDLDVWITYPDVLESKTFGGYQTRNDVTEIKGQFPIGQNIIFTDGGKPTVRQGYEPIGAEVTGITTPVTRAWRFERRDAVEIEMKAYGTGMYAYIDGVSSEYSLLKDGFTSGKKFTFDVISKNTNATSKIYFCNGVDAWYSWTGVYGLVVSFDDAAHTLTIDSDITITGLGFPASGTIIVNGLEITYTGITGASFTGCSSMASLTAPAGTICLASPIAISTSDMLVSSVSMAHDNRIHMRNEVKASVHLFSQYGDPENYTVTGLDGGGGATEIEQGGPITAFGKDENKIYIFKKRLIKVLEYVSGGSRIDIPKYSSFKSADDKSTTIGAIGDKSTFHAPNGIIFVTEDKEMLMLKRQEYIDYPQHVSLSDPIKPTFQLGVHDDAAGIVYKSKIYYAYKQNQDSDYNDTVIVYDLIRNRWFTPIVGWNVADWTIINNELHWHSSTSPNSYRVIDDKTDNAEAFTTVLRTHAETFDFPQYQNNVCEIMIELYMTSNTEINLDILYDEDGYTEIVSTKLSGMDTNNIINAKKFNAYGSTAFGEEVYGSNSTVHQMDKYRYIIPLKANNEFYNISLQLSTTGAGMNYELIRYGYHVDGIFLKHQKKFIFKI